MIKELLGIFLLFSVANGIIILHMRKNDTYVRTVENKKGVWSPLILKEACRISKVNSDAYQVTKKSQIASHPLILLSMNLPKMR